MQAFRPGTNGIKVETITIKVFCLYRDIGVEKFALLFK